MTLFLRFGRSLLLGRACALPEQLLFTLYEVQVFSYESQEARVYLPQPWRWQVVDSLLFDSHILFGRARERKAPKQDTDVFFLF